MDEDTVLKTAGAFKALVGSNPTASANFYTGAASGVLQNDSKSFVSVGSIPTVRANFI